MEWKVTINREDLSRITVFVDADSTEDAKQKALDMGVVRDYLSGYDGLYVFSILSPEQQTKIKYFQERANEQHQENSKKKSRNSKSLLKTKKPKNKAV